MNKPDDFHPRSAFYSLLFVGFLFSSGTRAESIGRDELIRRLRIRSDVVLLSEDGKRLTEVGDESRVISGFTKEGQYRRDWSSKSTNYGFKLRHEWTIDPSGKIHVSFEEFSEEELDSKTGTPKDFKNPIGKEEREIVDFGAILYTVKAIKGRRVVLRFIPELASDGRSETIGPFRLMGRGVSIYDSEGALWASELELNSRYSAISTYRGTLVLSFSAFKGAEPAGTASGKKITLRMKDYPRVVLQSETDFVPEGMNALVFVRYLKDRRTTGINSVHLQETSSEKRLRERLKEL